MNDHIYKKIEITGSSEKGIQDAVEKAIAKAGKTLHDMRWFELIDVRGHLNGGKVEHWQATLKIGFEIEP